MGLQMVPIVGLERILLEDRHSVQCARRVGSARIKIHLRHCAQLDTFQRVVQRFVCSALLGHNARGLVQQSLRTVHLALGLQRTLRFAPCAHQGTAVFFLTRTLFHVI